MPFIIPVVEAVVAIGAAVGSFVAGAGIIGQGLIMAGIGIASSYLISALTPKPQTDANQVGGVNFQRDYGTNVPRQVGCGLFALAGHDIYVNTFNPSNRTLQQVYVVSDYPVTALTRVWAGGVLLQLGVDIGDGKGRPVIGPSSVTFANGGLVWIKFYNGQQTAADGFLQTFANPVGRWTSADIGIGVSFISVLIEYDKDNNNSFPDFFFEFQGAPLYDWRKDSTNGGSGLHRWGNIATHEYSANPIVMEYNYRRGFSINNDPFCGMFMAASDLPVNKFTAAANICDELVSGLPRYRCSILLNCMVAHSDNLQSLALSCGAMQIDSIDGSWPLVGSSQIVVDTFTDADLISTAQNFKRIEKQSMSTLVNSVSGNYAEPNQLWSMVGYDQQTSSSFVVIDRRTRDINMNFPQVSNLRQADQLAWIYLYENRYEATATVTLRPRFQRLEAGDWIDWNSARYGLKTFIVTGKQLLSLDSGSGPRNVVLTLQERNGMIYQGITPSVPVLPFPPGDPVYMSQVQSLAALPVTVTGSNGVYQAAIRVSWLPPTDVTVVQVDVEYYPTGDPTSIIHKIVNVDQTVVICGEGVVGLTSYTVRTKLITNPPRTLTFDAGVTVTTLANSKLSITDFNAALQYQTTTLLNKQNDRIANLEAQAAAVASNLNARQWNNKQMMQTQLMSVTGTLSASITSVMTVATNTQTAFASYVTTTNATLGGQSVSITNNTTAIASINTGLLASWSMTLNVAGHISGLKLLSDGTTAAFVIETNVFQVSNPAAFGGAAQTVFTLQTVSGVTQMALRGDFIADGAITARMASFGSLSALSANLGTVTTGLMQSVDGLFVIDLTNKRIVISV